MRYVLLGCALILGYSVARADDSNPEHNGKTMTAWMTMVRENDAPRLRRIAVGSLSAIGQDALPKIRREVCVALGKVFRSDGSAVVRAEAGKALGDISTVLLNDGELGDTSSVVIDLAEGLRVEKELEPKRTGTFAVGRFGPKAKSAVGSLTALLADKDAVVRENAANSLGRIGGESKIATDDLLKLLGATEVPVRKAAVFALGRIDPEDKAKVSLAMAPLFAIEKDQDVRMELVLSLGLLKEKNSEVAKALAPLLKETHLETRRLAAKTMAMFEESAKNQEKELVTAFKTDSDKLVRSYALRALCATVTDTEKLVPILVTQLDSKTEKEADVRIAVCDELGLLGPDAQAAVPVIRDTQKDPEPKVRDAAAAALKKLIAKKK
jgi:HEAT repeat protein